MDNWGPLKVLIRFGVGFAKLGLFSSSPGRHESPWHESPQNPIFEDLHQVMLKQHDQQIQQGG